MLMEVGWPANARKLLLFGCACLWVVRDEMSPEALVALEEVERIVDTAADYRSWEKLFELEYAPSGKVWDLERGGLSPNWTPAIATVAAMQLPGSSAYDIDQCGFIVIDELGRMTDHANRCGPAVAAAWQRGRALLRELIRDIFGAPGRTVPINPAWLAWNNGTGRRLAELIYEEKRFDHLPVLADALEEAGCGEAALLRHCREPGGHVRGCWAVDALLGKPPVVWASQSG
jgi:hypothetical protein